MTAQCESSEIGSIPRNTSADLLALGLGTAIAMWIVGYISHIPLLALPPAGAFALFILIQLLSGWLTGRYTRRSRLGAIGIALISLTVNLLVLGSLLHDTGPSPALWLPGYAAVSIVLMLLGHALGRARPSLVPVNWPLVLCLGAVAATALVVSAGGLVTGFDAGFSVPDWPTTYQMNMFVYPLSRMTGGIYYEHTHRLAGALVGLTSIVVMIHLARSESRRSVKALAVGMFALVCTQGLLGGLWVTEVDPADTVAMAHAVQRADGSFIAEPTLAYVMIHGAMGQLILAGFAVLAATQSRIWRDCRIVTISPASATDRAAGALATSGLAVQLLIGVYLRKQGEGLLIHITMAVVVAAMVLAVAMRAWAVWGETYPVLRKLGLATLGTLGLQLTLGVAALIAREVNHATTVTVGSDATSSPIDAIITTLHQSTGAALLALVGALWAWNTRLLKTPALPPLPEAAHSRASAA